MVCHYAADYQPGMHTAAFSVVCVITRTQREDLSVFSGSHLNVTVVSAHWMCTLRTKGPSCFQKKQKTNSTEEEDYM